MTTETTSNVQSTAAPTTGAAGNPPDFTPTQPTPPVGALDSGAGAATDASPAEFVPANGPASLTQDEIEERRQMRAARLTGPDAILPNGKTVKQARLENDRKGRIHKLRLELKQATFRKKSPREGLKEELAALEQAQREAEGSTAEPETTNAEATAEPAAEPNLGAQHVATDQPARRRIERPGR